MASVADSDLPQQPGYTEIRADFPFAGALSKYLLSVEHATMRTITTIPLPDEQEPDLFDLPPAPAPEQLELFAEEDLKEVAPTMDSQTEN